MTRHLLLAARQPFYLRLELGRVRRGRRSGALRIVRGCMGSGRCRLGGEGFALGGYLAFYVFESVSTLSVEIWMAERPTLYSIR